VDKSNSVDNLTIPKTLTEKAEKAKKPKKKKELIGQKLSYAARPLVVCSIPQTHRPNIREYEKRNGNAKLSLSAINKKFDLPFGRDRHLLYYIRSLAQLNKSPRIDLPSVSKMLQEMGFSDTGTNRKWLRDAFMRCHHTIIFYVEGDPERGGCSKGELMIREMNGLFLRGEEGFETDRPSYIVISDHFFQCSNIPIDLNFIHRLGRHYTAIDLYCCLRARLHKCKSRSNVVFFFKDLRDQFGLSEDVSDHHFKQSLREAIKKLAKEGFEAQPQIVDDKIVIPFVELKPVLSAKIQKAFSHLDKPENECG
jgi:hypothetical protein